MDQMTERQRKFNFSWDDYCARKCDLNGLEFDNYKITSRLGKGSFATVYKATITSTGQQVAIKVINLKQMHSIANSRLKQIKLRLTQSQPRIMMLLNSPNIIKCYETFQSTDFKFMILQYCNGGDLATRIYQQKCLQQDEAINVLKQIVNGIAECHRMKIIHRDLKPENIMIHNGVYKIADFGFSKVLSITGQNQYQTCINTTLGTPTTMAPEVKNFQPYGLKADIWSIGVIFFHMLFGKCPFQSRQNFNKIVLRISAILQKQEFYQGVRIDDKVRKFLKQTLVVDQKQRIGWKQLVRHSIFQEEENVEEIVLRSSCFQRKVSLVVNEDEMQKVQDQVVIKNQQKQGINEDDQQIQNMLRSLGFADSVIKERIKEQEKDQGLNKLKQQPPQLILKRCSSYQLPSQEQQHPLTAANNLNFLPQQQQDEDSLYQWSRHTYLECLKTQLIFRKIIVAIQTNKLLDLSQRKSIQLMYLLCTRCYNNMSPVYYEYSKHKNSQVLKQLSQCVEKLYDEVGNKWQRYSYLLTVKQNEKLQIAADWTKRVILSKLFPQTYDYNKKQRFMTGIESLQNYNRLSHEVYHDAKKQLAARQHVNDGKTNDNLLKDYTKEEQIRFTIEQFKQCKDYFINKQSKQSKEVFQYLRRLERICNITLQELKSTPFKKYVQDIVLQEPVN